jgi:DNA-binding transcriptional ArsR family regulator
MQLAHRSEKLCDRPSLRTFATQAGISKSAAGRDLAELVEARLITRKRRPGGVYVYRVARRFLPRWTKEQVSQAWDRQREARRARRADGAAKGVPVLGTEEKPDKKNQGNAHVRARSADRKVNFGELPDPTDRWRVRVRSWVRSDGKFWLADWGPRPNEPGCWAPRELLQATG